MEATFNPITAIILLIVLIYSAILHEIAHGYVAEKLGDPTARLLGRLTLNPLSHVDLFLTVILPLLLFLSNAGIIFGGAKPVPVDPYNLKEGRKDIALVSLAGPATNILLLLLAALVFKFIDGNNATGLVGIIAAIFRMIVHVNLSLAIFNLLPIPPLDGSKIFALFLPEELANTYLSLSSIGTFLLLILLMFPTPGFSLINIIGSIFIFAQKILGI